MAKVYTLTFYTVDANDYYDDALHLFSQMTSREHQSGVFFMADRDDLLSSNEFEWEDDIPINYQGASKEDFEKYFQKEI